MRCYHWLLNFQGKMKEHLVKDLDLYICQTQFCTGAISVFACESCDTSA